MSFAHDFADRVLFFDAIRGLERHLSRGLDGTRS
jgi:hypothetical protein